MKFKFNDAFEWQGKRVLADGLNWLYCSADSSKAHSVISISCKSLKSLHQANLKTGAKFWQNFWGMPWHHKPTV